ncbi:unnamed protein product [Caenorhabditis angaria]|uniref:C-type lectin domain-containing protein n=1 Tax=Caenorhabditis angaria TaxID=860376 RepID=A0A9P1J129_9PELO|nr:unnamed protein product [Caenorhabditis angaria]
MLLTTTFLIFFVRFCDCCMPTKNGGMPILNEDLDEPEEVISTSQSPEEPTTTTTTEASEDPKCPDDTWILFNRGTYSWCMKTAIASIQQAEAAETCQNLNANAVPSGFQNAAEVTTMIAQARAANNGEDARFYIGAERVENCIGKGITASCTKLNSFKWTDGKTTGTDGWIWEGIQPNNWQFQQNYVYLDTEMGGLADGNGLFEYPGVICGVEAS